MSSRSFLASIFLFAALVSFSNAAEPVYPNYVGYVNDFANVLDSSTKNQINEICVSLEAITKSELAVVTVKTTAPLDSKSYVVKLFEKWKVGKKGLDNGVIFLLASDDRRVEIEVGYGLEGVINDAKAGEILDQFVVLSFKKGDFSEGMLLGSKALSQRIIEKYDKPQVVEEKEDWVAIIIGLVVIIILPLALLIYVIIKKQFVYLFIVAFAAIVGYFIEGPFGALLGFIAGLIMVLFDAMGWGGKGGSGSLSGSSGRLFGGGSSSFGGGSGGGFSGFGGGRSSGGGTGRSF
ncbi:TPM domain-containing protein [Candidatus Saganbacteria bacterium]|nr:TPM domain-containing protein [Candidatus Saganbacteria bacterium]